MSYSSGFLSLLVHGAVALAAIGALTLAILYVRDVRGKSIW